MSGFVLVKCVQKPDAEERYENLPDVVLRMGNRAFKIVGYHEIHGVGWHCLENVANGERRDLQLSVLNRLYDEGVIENLTAMEALAYAARGGRGSKT